MKKFFGIAISVLVVVGGLLVYYLQKSDVKTLRVNGSALAAPQVREWAKSFTEKHRDTIVRVTGDTTPSGFRALFSREAEIAAVTRLASVEEEKEALEKGIKLTQRLIGHTGVTLITHPRNPVNELTVEQIRKIFSGEYTNWKDVGGPDAPIKTITRTVPESGAAAFFQEHVLDNRPYGPNTLFAESWESIINFCNLTDDLPIGLAPSLQSLKGVKVLAIKNDEKSPAVKPSAESLMDRSYPIILPFRFYWDSRTMDPRLKLFVKHCADEGLGKFPVSPDEK